MCLCHSSFVYARGQCASRYTFLFPFVYNGVNNKWYVYIVFTFVSKWITFSRKDNLSVKVILMFLYKIYANVSFGTRSYTHTHTHTHKHIYRCLCLWDFPGENTGVGCHFPFLPPRNLSDPVIEPMCPSSPALAERFFTIEPPGKPYIRYIYK